MMKRALTLLVCLTLAFPAWAVQDFLLTELGEHRELVLLGDFNIAPEDRDVHDPDLWRDEVLCSEKERRALRSIMGIGLGDTFRKFDQEAETYTWWDYRAAAFRRNRGLRIDHILCSGPMYDRCIGCTVDKEPRKGERPSDHAPLTAEFSD